MAKKNIKTLKKTDGKASILDYCPPTRKGKIKSLDDLFNDKLSVYATHNLETYKTEIMGMNMVDLQKEAIRISLFPVNNRNLLVERLIKKFEQTTNAILQKTPAPRLLKVGKKGSAVLSEGANKLV